MSSIIYDGVDLTQSFELVSLDMPVMPGIELNTIDVPGAAGALFVERKVASRVIRMGLRLATASRCPLDIFNAWSAVSDLVSKTDPRPLVLNEETGDYVNAILTGESIIETRSYYGEVDLEFTCPDPYIYASSTSSESASGTRHEIEIDDGSQDVRPLATIEFTGGNVDTTLEDVRITVNTHHNQADGTQTTDQLKVAIPSINTTLVKKIVIGPVEMTDAVYPDAILGLNASGNPVREYWPDPRYSWSFPVLTGDDEIVTVIKTGGDTGTITNDYTLTVDWHRRRL